MPEFEVIIILLAAAFIHGAFGFGFPLVATPLLALVMDFRAAILITLIPTVSINLVSILLEKGWFKVIKYYWPLPTFTILGSIVGTQVILNVDPEPFRALLAIVVIGYLLLQRQSRSEVVRYVPQWGMALFGLVLGLLAGVTNVFSPLIVVYALYTGMQAAAIVAVFNLSFITSKLGQIAGYVLNEQFVGQVVEWSLWLLPAILLSLLIGIRLRKKLKDDAYKQMLRAVLWVIAFVLIIDVYLHL